MPLSDPARPHRPQGPSPGPRARPRLRGGAGVLLCLLCLLPLLAAPAPARAQAGFVAGGAGLGVGWTTVGGERDLAVGPTLALQGGTADGGRRRWLVELAATPFRVDSPVRDEGYRSATLLVGRAFGERLSLTPSVGLQLRRWSGEERVEPSDLGLAWGVTAGTRLELAGGLVILPELTWRASSIELEGGVGGNVLALRLLVARGLGTLPGGR